jgi:pseudouridine-5'-phosphate glycosidase
MPFPQNLETARDVESVVRDNGAVPATIAILEGVIHVGTKHLSRGQALPRRGRLREDGQRTRRTISPLLGVLACARFKA